MAEARAVSETTQGSLVVLYADSFAAALRTAYDLLTAIGMTAFAERARAELAAAEAVPPTLAGWRVGRLVAKVTALHRRR
jgi:hypothetical protein